MNRYKAYLRKRPHYGDMINEIEVNQPKIKYPDRRATFLRNTHYLSQFDGDQSFINLEEQESKMAKERILEEEFRRMARETGGTHMGLQATAPSDTDSVRRNITNRQAFYLGESSSSSSSSSDAMNDIDGEQARRELETKVQRHFISKRARDKLQTQSKATDTDIMQYATPRTEGNAASGTEYEERPGASDNHGGYVAKKVKSLKQMFNLKNEKPKSPEGEETRRKIIGKQPSRK